MKIAIVGGGISGLSAYLFLKKHLPSPPSTFLPHEIIIYESHKALSRKQRLSVSSKESEANKISVSGAGLGVAANGMRTLRNLDLDIHDAVVSQGYPAVRFQMKSSHNWTLGSMPTVDFRGEPEVMVMSSRQGVWDSLRDKIPDEALICGKTVALVLGGFEGKHVLEFSDGSVSDEYDLIIGADGVKSVVRKAVVGDGIQDEYLPHYEGLIGVGGFISSEYLPDIPTNKIMKSPQGLVVMTFGAEGFFGYGPSTTAPGSILRKENLTQDIVLPYGREGMWWSTYMQEAVPDIKRIDKDEIRRQLLKRHGKWKDPIIQKIITESNIDSVVASWVTPKLPTWVRDGLILVGDAAHALPSTSGQGVSTALEDVYAFALLISYYLSSVYSLEAVPGVSKQHKTEQDAIKIALEKYIAVRKTRVDKIFDAANKMVDKKREKGFVGEWIMYLIMWMIFTFFPNVTNKPVFEYSVEEEVDNAIKVGAKI